MNKIKKLVIEFKNGFRWTPIAILWLMITLVYMIDDNVFSPEWFLYYLYYFIFFSSLILLAFFKWRNDDHNKRLEMKIRNNKQHKLEIGDQKIMDEFMAKYRDKHFTKLNDDDYSVWRFLSNSKKDEFIDALDEYKHLPFKSKKFKAL